ncbi:hypothetical protein TWF102_006133 [Orbilia oligospora]|uniref:Uncharacterized protein n=1 Tax=Orbilia oligospora TaxID=2813651 RepID=A0A7C8JPT0_ORBOL|nr:hypothetical protein TWF706_002752 [Orbilia oligospora]KAF3097609.1 hypothetical protein TWF103_009538 [Orbilia oligospora]KAF3098142.1 hypothetical protein TWF102_006133 [Orbilia oligospora]KAF3132767.1 hypothetical protein TWF703_007233 [Orbilia oligospora]KAF3151386.1 hypothetical protein TWF594_007034 [Orbilia oligospora]
MVAIDAIKSSNAAAKAKLPLGLVALFVGATSGIGEHTLRNFYQTAPSPRVYFVGRSQSSADRIIADLKPLNPDGHLEFIQADATLIKNVDEVTRKFLEKEKELNVLVMSQGYLTSEGRVETTEGLDAKLALNYFSRARLIQNLLPSLSAAATSSPFGARVLSVLSAGNGEGKLNFDDFELKKTFSLRNAGIMATTSNSAIVKYLAKEHSNIGFIHAFPGGVETNIMEAAHFHPIAKWTARILMPLARPWMFTQEESGQRHFYLTTNEKFKAGGWLTDSMNEESSSAQKFVDKGLCDEKVGEKVWKMTLEVFERLEKERTA